MCFSVNAKEQRGSNDCLSNPVRSVSILGISCEMVSCRTECFSALLRSAVQLSLHFGRLQGDVLIYHNSALRGER